MSTLSRTRMAGAAAMLAAMALTATSLPALAAPTGDISVSGAALSVLEVNISTSSIAFPADMRPDGTHTDADESGDDGAPAGHCFWWVGTDNLEVKSNVTYDLTVDVATTGTDRAQLLFSSGTAPSDYASCVSGTPVVSPMAGANPIAATQTATASTDYDTHFAVTVPWTAGPFSVATTVTFTAAAS